MGDHHDLAHHGLCTCQVVTYTQAVDLAHKVTATPMWQTTLRGPVILCSKEYRPQAFGSTSGRVVRFAERLPVCTVPHELAHVLARDGEHGHRWAAFVWRLYPLCIDVWLASPP